MIIACMFFAAVGGFAKVLSEQMSSIEVVFFRNAVGLAIVLYAIYKRPPTHQKGGQFCVLMFRGFIGTIALFALLKEALSKKGWGAIFLGFIGILFIIQPNLGISKTDWLGLWSGVGAALAMLSVRTLRKSYDTSVIVLSFMAWGTALPMLLMGIAEWVKFESLDFLLSPFVAPNFKGVILIVLMGLAGYFFQFYMTKAYAASKKAGSVAAISYMDVVFSLVVGYFMGDTLPNAAAFFCIMQVVISGIIVERER